MNGKIGRKPDRKIPVQEKEPKPRRKALRLRLDEEVFGLLEKEAEASQRGRQRHAELLLSNAIRASWSYDFHLNGRDIPAVKSAYDFFAGLYHRQAKALKEIQRASIAAKNATAAAAQRCQWWLDKEKARRADRATGKKVLKGKFRRSA
jgi:hypothetical protein